MEPEGSLPHLQVPATCPYPEPARSTLVSNNIYPAILPIVFEQFSVKICIWLKTTRPFYNSKRATD